MDANEFIEQLQIICTLQGNHSIIYMINGDSLSLYIRKNDPLKDRYYMKYDFAQEFASLRNMDMDDKTIAKRNYGYKELLELASSVIFS